MSDDELERNQAVIRQALDQRKADMWRRLQAVDQKHDGRGVELIEATIEQAIEQASGAMLGLIAELAMIGYMHMLESVATDDSA